MVLRGGLGESWIPENRCVGEFRARSIRVFERSDGIHLETNFVIYLSFQIQYGD